MKDTTAWKHQFKFRCTIITLLFSCSTITLFAIQEGHTALRVASFSGHHKVVELLLGAGANPNVQDKVKTVMYILMVLCAFLYSYYTVSTLSIPVLISSTKTLPNCSAYLHYDDSYKFIVY